MTLGSLDDFGKPFKMPAKQPGDPDPIVSILGDDHLVIRCGEQSITVSGYNAARIVGVLSLFLNIKFTRQTARKLRV